MAVYLFHNIPSDKVGNETRHAHILRKSRKQKKRNRKQETENKQEDAGSFGFLSEAKDKKQKALQLKSSGQQRLQKYYEKEGTQYEQNLYESNTVNRTHSSAEGGELYENP